jgi:hypothetical protein
MSAVERERFDVAKVTLQTLDIWLRQLATQIRIRTRSDIRLRAGRAGNSIERHQVRDGFS